MSCHSKIARRGDKTAIRHDTIASRHGAIAITQTNTARLLITKLTKAPQPDLSTLFVAFVSSRSSWEGLLS
jgi:hypothetical protein